LNLNQFEKLLILVLNQNMSTEVNSLQNQNEPDKITHKQKVDINILLNRARHEKKKKEKKIFCF